MGFKLGTTWLIGFAAVAEGVATLVFVTWAKSAVNLEEKEKGCGS